MKDSWTEHAHRTENAHWEMAACARVVGAIRSRARDGDEGGGGASWELTCVVPLVCGPVQACKCSVMVEGCKGRRRPSLPVRSGVLGCGAQAVLRSPQTVAVEGMPVPDTRCVPPCRPLGQLVCIPRASMPSHAEARLCALVPWE